MDISSIIHDLHSRKFVIILTMLTVLTLITAPQLAATPYSGGYSHGCDDGKVGFHKYLNTPGKGIDNHTPEFMQGYDDGYKACFSPNGSDSDNSSSNSKTHSQSTNSDTAGTFVSCNKSEHTTTDENITPKFHVKVAGLVQNTVQDINKGMQTRTIQCFLLLTRLI
jgi:hypothetical protein